MKYKTDQEKLPLAESVLAYLRKELTTTHWTMMDQKTLFRDGGYPNPRIMTVLVWKGYITARNASYWREYRIIDEAGFRKLSAAQFLIDLTRHSHEYNKTYQAKKLLEAGKGGEFAVVRLADDKPCFHSQTSAHRYLAHHRKPDEKYAIVQIVKTVNPQTV